MMDWHYSVGKLSALEKLGMARQLASSSRADKIKNWIKSYPEVVVGGVTGTGLAGATLASKDDIAPKMEPPLHAGNPLSSNL